MLKRRQYLILEQNFNRSSAVDNFLNLDFQNNPAWIPIIKTIGRNAQYRRKCSHTLAYL